MKRPAISITNLTKEQLEELIPKSNTLHEYNILNTVYLNIHLNVSITGLLMNSFMASYRTVYKEVHSYEEFMQLWDQIKLMELL